MNRFSFPERKIYRVSELVGELNHQLERDFSEIWVQGEITDLRNPKSGNYFFSLKDEKAKLGVVMFRFQAIYLKFALENGLEVIARGYLNIYPERGELRLVADYIEPVGIGALQLAFEQLKKKLEAEGLFAQERKKPLPDFFQRIAIITSPTGAVIQDMLRVFREQGTQIEILLIPSRVQGEGAEYELAKALEWANHPKVRRAKAKPELDLIILARGGGSLEDLYPFNTELLAREIARSKVPVMSAIGHEIDYTIADLVADIRALTPTRAAEIIAQKQRELLDRFYQAQEELKKILTSRLQLARERVRIFYDLGRRIQNQLEITRRDLVLASQQMNKSLLAQLETRKMLVREFQSQLLKFSPSAWLRNQRTKLYELERALSQSFQSQLNQTREKFYHLAGKLDSLSPLATLSRGYSITRNQKGEILKEAQKAVLGELLEILLARGEVLARVEEKKEKHHWEK